MHEGNGRRRRIDVHLNFPPDFMSALGDIVKKLTSIERKVTTMSAELDRLSAEVAETKTVVDSAIVLIEGMAKMIRDNAANPAALKALADELDAKTNALAAKVTENTPSVPPA